MEKEKVKQIIFVVIVILAIAGLVVVSLLYNGKLSKDDSKGKEENQFKEEISSEEYFNQVQTEQQKREEEAKKLVENDDLKLDISSKEFEEKVLKADKPVLVDFYAAWCPPCQTMAPIIENLSKEQTDFYVYKVNTDLETALATSEEIFSIPTFIVYKDGKRTNSAMGVMTKEKLIEIVKKDAK